MRWIKYIFINLFITLLILYSIEGLAYTIRYFSGAKQIILPFSSYFYNLDKNNNCEDYKSDVLLGVVNDHFHNCNTRNGKVLGEYVVYGNTTKTSDYILTLGGSTTSGFYQKISDGYVWPLLLHEEVSKYTVINGGVNGYTSLQEFYKFARDGARIKNLKLVISLNGINEIPNYQGKEPYRSTHYPFLSETQFLINENQTWIDQRRKNYSNLLLVYKILIPNIYSLIKNKRIC
jgi:Lysophospholipase L1 and related esterases